MFYRACDFVCVPSAAEPFGRTVIEAFASGTPVIASAVGGMKETIKNRETGLLVEYGDTKGFSKAISELAGSEELRNRLSFQARETATQLYTANIYQRKLTQIINSSLKSIK